MNLYILCHAIFSTPCLGFLFFFFNDTATTEIYTLSLHDALPISGGAGVRPGVLHDRQVVGQDVVVVQAERVPGRSEEHTSELQSQSNLVCRLLLEKKKNINNHAACKRCMTQYDEHIQFCACYAIY